MMKYQIGIMGSAGDLNFSLEAKNFAVELGKLIAKSNNILVYGAESTYTSLSTQAAISACACGGITVGVTSGISKKIFGDFRPDVLVASGLELGGGREFALVNTCDVIIAISGGSGTLTEIAIAYQANIPIVVIDIFGGWAQKLSGQYLDERKRIKCISAKSPKKALNIALELLKK